MENLFVRILQMNFPTKESNVIYAEVKDNKKSEQSIISNLHLPTYK